MAEFVAVLATALKLLGVAFFTGGSALATLAVAYQLSRIAAARRERRRAWAQAWDTTEDEVRAFADSLRTQPPEPPDDDELIGVVIAPSPLLTQQPPEDLSWLAPTGAYPIVTPTSYGTPALLHTPVELRWARWTTPVGGVPVLTAAGAVW